MLRRITKIPGVRWLWRKFPIGSVGLKVEYNIWKRPDYAHGIYLACQQASTLGLEGISVLEFGVAGGNGLLAMEEIAEEMSKHFKIKIDVVGFDSGSGMPAPIDYRDLPHVWDTGFYKMDVEALKKRLKRAQVILGDAGENAQKFVTEAVNYPVGFISFDLDYYSSTKKAFSIFAGDTSTRIPRVICYFDDIISPLRALYCDYTGELCAIREFNEEHEHQKIAKIPYFSWLKIFSDRWNDQMYVFHDFEHPLYVARVTDYGDEHEQLPLQ